MVNVRSRFVSKNGGEPEYGKEKGEGELSRYFISSEIGQVYRGMMVALPPEEWIVFRTMSQTE